MVTIFLLGILMVALEDKIGINKAASALLMAVVLWVAASVGADMDISSLFVEQLGETSETLFFVMGALVIIELVDTHGGFRVITSVISTTNKRKLLWIVAFLTFFLSAILNNIATGVVMIALLRKLVPTKHDRLIFASMIILAANAGGSFSPIGDVTTILLWTGGNLTPEHQISMLLLPSLINMVVPLVIMTFWFKAKSSFGKQLPIQVENATMPEVGRKSRYIILILGVSTMVLVPFFNSWSGVPPFMRVMMGMAVLWIYTDLMYGKMKQIDEKSRLSVGRVLSRIDMSTIIFFLGILMSVGALNVSGQLGIMGDFMSSHISNPLTISFVIGIMSSFVDNVALVAATMGMYPLAEVGAYAMNSEFWTFLAYCAVTGGSLLIIGSATGVTIMGMEKITFMYYFRRISLLAVAGYVSGAACFVLLNLL